ncbi:signal peptidase I [Streptococcus dentiloxodontae]
MVKRDLIRNIILAALIIVIILLLRIFVFSTHRITDSQANSYLHSGDYVTFNKNVEPTYKDFVVYTVDGEDYVGRVIASQGQTVTFMDDILYVDNEVVDEPYIEAEKEKYLSSVQAGSVFTDDFTIATLTNSNQTSIKKGQYLILNDNRRNTKDSREFGLISGSQIKGVVSFRLYPLSKFGFVKTN